MFNKLLLSLILVTMFSCACFGETKTLKYLGISSEGDLHFKDVDYNSYFISYNHSQKKIVKSLKNDAIYIVKYTPTNYYWCVDGVLSIFEGKFKSAKFVREGFPGGF